MGLGIDELLARIGIDDVRIQFLNECLTNATKRKKGVALTFYTQETTVDAFMQDEPQTIGIVVWVPYRKFRNVQNSWNAEHEPARETP